MILVTGGAGYIGSHTVLEILRLGMKVTIVDNFSNSNKSVVEKLRRIYGDQLNCITADVCDGILDDVFENTVDIDGVIHFAGFKAVGESVNNPIKYYKNNLESTISVVESMRKYNLNNLVFSSSATVYSSESELKCHPETDVVGDCSNPYGWTKYMCERIIEDVCNSDKEFNATSLRYFNPIGADSSGIIGENPNGIPNNLMPYIVRVASGEYDKLKIYGDDYDTDDGTGVRDYIHVSDLADAHIKVIDAMLCNTIHGYNVYNVGSGRGTSVLELVNTFKSACGIDIPYEIVDRRPGDIDINVANPSKINHELGWYTKHTTLDMCRDAWNYELKRKETE